VYAGIVGHEAAKFTPETEAKARAIIRTILEPEGTVLVSGRCHLGGVDVWAEELCAKLGREMLIFPPAKLNWNEGYRPRNIQIAKASDKVHVIVVAEYPGTYGGMRFNNCYHCNSSDHIKSGGCWTARYALAHGKEAEWHVI